MTIDGVGSAIRAIVHFDTPRDYTLQITVNTHTNVHSHVFTTVAW
jgi:hypothetical protein